MNLKKFLAASLAALTLLSPMGVFSASPEADSALNSAHSYLSQNNFPFTHKFLSDYAAATKNDPAASSTHISHANALRDAFLFNPTVAVSNPSGEPIFFGSDAYVPGASAIKIPMTFGLGSLEDYLPQIPYTKNELSILLSLYVNSEKILRSIAYGYEDDYIISLLRTLASLEGRLYLSFCPSVNYMRPTVTLKDSFLAAFRHVAELCRRFAPNVSLTFTAADIHSSDPSAFFPGSEFVDVIGVEITHTYNRSDPLDPKAAFDCRGQFYSPLTSAKLTVDAVRKVAGDLPVIIESVSFPSDGTASVSDYISEMELFYKNLPVLIPETIAVFYSNRSNSYGISNLRRDESLMQAYLNAANLPCYKFYEKSSPTSNLSPIENVTRVIPGAPVEIELWCGHIYGSPEKRVFLNGTETNAPVLTPGTHLLEIYVTDPDMAALLSYTLTVTEDGSLTVTVTDASSTDFNGNGILDVGDVQYLTATVAGWSFSIPESAVRDVNGDGRVNLTDVAVLRGKMTVK